MKIINWLRENWFKLSLLAIAIIVFLFYLLLWSPAQKKRETLSNNIKCQQEGSQLFEKEKKESATKEGFFRNARYLEPEFRFNNELNTCLYKGASLLIIKDITFFPFFIKDVYTNKPLASYSESKINGKPPDVGAIRKNMSV